MCNLYTLRLSRDEVAGLLSHYKLVGKDFADAMAEKNDGTRYYPNYEAPIVVVRNGQRVIETMRWGFPPPPFLTTKLPVTNIRNKATDGSE